MEVVVGSLTFVDVIIHLIIGDRFFHFARDEDGRLLVDVVQVDFAGERLYPEVVRSQPVAANVTSNPTGVVTFIEDDGGFLFKFRPDANSSLFGRVPAGGEVSVSFRDSGITVFGGEDVIATLADHRIANKPVGLNVQAQSIGLIGLSWPEGLPVAPFVDLHWAHWELVAGPITVPQEFVPPGASGWHEIGPDGGPVAPTRP